MKIIGLHGLPRSGKDTVARKLALLANYEHTFFAAPLKSAASILLNRPWWQCNGDDGFDREAVMPEWGFSMRWFLQHFGTECMRDQIAQDFWLKRMGLELSERAGQNANSKVVITDVRFQNEADFLRSRGASIVGVIRPGTTGSTHSSDQLLHCDWTIENTGTLEDLGKQILHFINDGRL